MPGRRSLVPDSGICRRDIPRRGASCRRRIGRFTGLLLPVCKKGQRQAYSGRIRYAGYAPRKQTDRREKSLNLMAAFHSDLYLPASHLQADPVAVRGSVFGENNNKRLYRRKSGNAHILLDRYTGRRDLPCRDYRRPRSEGDWKRFRGGSCRNL